MNQVILQVINVFFGLLFIFFSRINSKGLNRILIFFHSIVYALLAAFRDQDYGDTKSYLEYFSSINSFGEGKFETIFNLLSIIIKTISGDPFCFLFFIAFLTFVILEFSLLEYFKSPKAFVIIWGMTCLYTIYYFSFEIIRDGLSYSIVIFAILHYLKNKRIIIFLFNILLSSLIHYSNIVFIFLPVIYKFKLRTIIWGLIPVGLLLSTILYFNSDLLAGLSSKHVIFYKLLYYKNQLGGSKTILIRNFILVINFFVFIFFRGNKKMVYLYIYFLLIIILTFPFVELNRRFMFKGTLFVLINYILIVSRLRLNHLLVLFLLIYFNFFLVNYKALYGLLNYVPIISIIF